MRKLILSMQVSLDGFTEGENGDISWVQKEDPEQWPDLFEMLESVDLLLLGRVMFPDYRDYWKSTLSNNNASSNHKRYAQLAEKTTHVVFSKTMKETGWDNTRIIPGNVVEEVKKLKTQPGKDIQVVGGAKLAATVMNAGLVDEYRIIQNPVVICRGKSFFRQLTRSSKLQLQYVKPLRSGVVILRYNPA
jgi:dihydrofolate reductase